MLTEAKSTKPSHYSDPFDCLDKDKLRSVKNSGLCYMVKILFLYEDFYSKDDIFLPELRSKINSHISGGWLEGWGLRIKLLNECINETAP